MAIVGGAKVSSKIAVLKNLVMKLDHVIIGGGMANTFLYRRRGANGARRLHEADQVETVAGNPGKLAEAHPAATLHLPEDVVCRDRVQGRG